MSEGLGELLVSEIAFAIIDRLELTAIDRHQFTTEEIQLLTQQRKGTADLLDRLEVIFAKIGDRLEIRRELFEQPHELNIASRLAFEETRGAQSVEIAIDIQLEQISWMVGGTATWCSHGAEKAELVKLKLINKGINEADWIVVGDIFIERRRKEYECVTLDALDMRHASLLLVNITGTRT